MISTDDIYRSTRDGLDIIYYFYPQARQCIEGTARHFKKRDSERTPSAAIKQIGGIWKVTDFGDSGTALSPIDICMHEKNMRFNEAIFFLQREFNIADTDAINKDINKPKIATRQANDDEHEGHFTYKENPEISREELHLLGPKVQQSDCQALSWLSLQYYTLTKKGITTTITSTDTYPIFMRRCQYYEPDGKTLNHFYKIYQPLNYDKSFRFFYKGEKPQRYINGLFELRNSYKKHNDQREKDLRNSGELGDAAPYHFEKIPEAFIVCGERDALCLHALNYSPLWFNSESYNLSESEYNELTKYVDRLYYIPDLDDTGVARAIELSSRYIDIYLVWLPEELKKYKDRRGNPRKDFRDFCEVWPEKKRFREQLNIAVPFRFWEYSNDKKRLDIITDYAMHFLRCTGFHCLEDKNSKTGKMFIHIQNNIVREIKAKDIRAHFRRFVRERYMTKDIRELVNNTTKLSETSLENLDEIQLDFISHTPTTQRFFFQNEIWEVTPATVNVFKQGKSAQYVWDNELIKHDVRRLDPAFHITHTPSDDDNRKWDITINPSHNSNYLRFLINASRMFWRKELENPLFPPDELADYRNKYKFAIDGPTLSAEEIEEQKHHLVNKIFCIGYLLHHYKAENRPWCVLAIDNKEGRTDESHGGSGKSFCFKTLRSFLQSVTISGSNVRITENKFLFESVTEYTKYILIDDADQYFPFRFFFDIVTGDLTVNPKHTKSYFIPFEKAPKFCITSNFALRNFDPSTSRRIIYTVFSDYYHEKTPKNDYLETRTVNNDFGKNLFRESYSDYEWNADINFLVDCCQFYLSIINDNIKLQPPMSNVIARNLRASMTDEFFDWAQVFFSEKSGNCDRLHSRSELHDDFKAVTGKKDWTSQRFTKSLKDYCAYEPRILALNPQSMLDANGRIVRKYKSLKHPEGVATDMCYIQTTPTINIESEYAEVPDDELAEAINPDGQTEVITNTPF